MKMSIEREMQIEKNGLTEESFTTERRRKGYEETDEKGKERKGGKQIWKKTKIVRKKIEREREKRDSNRRGRKKMGETEIGNVRDRQMMSWA
jgi:hypothetical protein